MHEELTRHAPTVYVLLNKIWQGEDRRLTWQNGQPGLRESRTVQQQGQLTDAGQGYYRLTLRQQGSGKSLDVINDGQNNRPHLANTGN